MSAGDVIWPVIMSRNVRLMMDSRLPELSSARRALFGPLDHEENLQFLREETNMVIEQDKMRWNFDFEKQTPLEGRYEWTVVQDDGAGIPQNLQSKSERTQRAAATVAQQSKLSNLACSGASCLTSFSLRKTKSASITANRTGASSTSKEDLAVKLRSS